MENINQNPADVSGVPVSPMPVTSLSPEQEQFVSRWSVGAFTLGMIYFFANGLIKEGFLMFVPFYNIYLYFKGIFRGRRMAWQKGEWLSFESFQKRQKILDRVGLAIFCLTIILIVIAFVGLFKATNPPVEAADTFLEQLSNNQVEAAYASTSNGFKQQTGLDEFKVILEQFPEFSHVKDTSFSSRSIESTGGVTTATLEGLMNTEDGKSYPLVVYLVKVGDKWQVAGMEEK